jgi:hypothetical protein
LRGSLGDIQSDYEAAMKAKRAQEAGPAPVIEKSPRDAFRKVALGVPLDKTGRAKCATKELTNPYDLALEFKHRLAAGEGRLAIARSKGLPSVAVINNRLRLLDLIPEAVKHVRAGDLSANAAYGLALAPKDAQSAILESIMSKTLRTVEDIKRAGREARKAA